MQEVWQSLRDYRVSVPERQEHWNQASLTSQEPKAQVELHELSSRDTTAITHKIQMDTSTQ